MQTTLKDQILASTEVDAHGEQRDKQYWDDIVAAMPPRMPLNQHHEHAMPTVGMIENIRVEPHGSGWAVMGDITFDGEPPTSGGFSFSATELVHRADERCLAVYVPFPYYQDATLIQALAATDSSTSVGKWIKESVEIAEAALIISAMNFVLGPMWRKVYEDKVHHRLVALANATLAALRVRGATRSRVDYLQLVYCSHYESAVELYFVPSEESTIEVVFGFAVVEAIEGSASLIGSDWRSAALPIRRIVYVFDTATCAYRPTSIVYVDGGGDSSHRQFQRSRDREDVMVNRTSRRNIPPNEHKFSHVCVILTPCNRPG